MRHTFDLIICFIIYLHGIHNCYVQYIHLHECAVHCGTIL